MSSHFISDSPILQESQQMLLNKGSDMLILSDSHVLLVWLFFFMLNLDAFLAPPLLIVLYRASLLICVICQASGGIGVFDPGI